MIGRGGSIETIIIIQMIRCFLLFLLLCHIVNIQMPTIIPSHADTVIAKFKASHSLLVKAVAILGRKINKYTAFFQRKSAKNTGKHVHTLTLEPKSLLDLKDFLEQQILTDKYS